MKESEIKKELRALLEKHSDGIYKRGAENYFKEKINLIGVRSSDVRRISREYFKNVKHLPKEKILKICTCLLSDDISEYSTIALDWAYRLRKDYEEEDFTLFRMWAENYIHNWGTCDNFSTHVLGEFLCRYGGFVRDVISLSSNDYWPVRRVSAVGLILPVRRGKNLKESFEVSRMLMNDEHYLVQKGYGWLLKEASIEFKDDVYRFIMKNRGLMTRTALRYALERYPENLRKRAMKKEGVC